MTSPDLDPRTSDPRTDSRGDPGTVRERPVALVTGSESGIGRATAVALAEAGFDLALTWYTEEHDPHRTEREVRDAGARAVLRRLDVTDLDGIAPAVDEIVGETGRLDALVNVAGTGTSTLLLDLDLATWHRVIRTDLDGPFVLLQAAARHMIARGRGGRVVNVTSVHERAPRVGAAPYCAAKGGLGLLTQVAALELAEHGITVNAVAPGEIATPMTGQEDEDPHATHRPGVPLGRPGDAREVAAVVAFLCGPSASYVTGASWAVDGGMLTMGPMAGSHLESDDWRRP
ncbi:SDR family oxidoreductase [Cellulosimicrobium sp. Marseille-Q4280]|uniref:SDR family oxidoreductase n=1 Tax=Cellulosimicrobium sp. Marseille-Q4280 TaxID=2937992 RepID=UPI00203B578E|nr:SDR family oxidoreductase [Cellulosimicrobium sp. Marseille-Q4280]